MLVWVYAMAFLSVCLSVCLSVRHTESQNEALCLEILSVMRRCLTQQADIRLILYEASGIVMCLSVCLSVCSLHGVTERSSVSGDSEYNETLFHPTG